MVVIAAALELTVSLVSLRHTLISFLYVLQKLIKLLYGFVNHIHSSMRTHLGT